MAASLEWGLAVYSKAVLENQLQYFIGEHGFVQYRGMEMSENARTLTLAAQYYFRTADSQLLLTYATKLGGIAELLERRRNESLAKFPVGDPRHGMAIGDDEADLWGQRREGAQTELPFFSITAEMWRGFRDCGDALSEVGAMAGKPEVVALGQRLSALAPAILSNLYTSIALTWVPGPTPRCLPYVAGSQVCGNLPGSHREDGTWRDSEPWKTYPEMFFSGAINASIISEVLAWHQTKHANNTKGSPLKLGVLTGCHDDMSCGDSFQTYSSHGWAYGLLQADEIEAFLLQYYAVSSHAYTRGTWIAPETTNLDRSQANAFFCTPASVTAALLLEWMLAIEAP